MSECREVRRHAGRWRAAIGRLVSVLVALAASCTAAHATPPTVVLVWVDRAGLVDAAAPFGVDAQRSFDGALRSLTAPGLCGGPAPAPGFECVQPSGLLRVLPSLICPAVQGSRADRVETLFTTLERRQLVRGFVSRLESTAVGFRLVRADGAWDLDEIHRSRSPHSDGAARTTRMRLECRAGWMETRPERYAEAVTDADAARARAPAVRPPTGVRPIPGAPLGVPTAVLVDGPDRIWIAHRAGRGAAGHGGVAIHERGAWHDASAGLDAGAELHDLHATPQGEVFAAGKGAAWRWEGAAWVRRLTPAGCLSPLRLTSLGPVLFGVCAYYPSYVAWPTRNGADVSDGPFLADIVSHAAALAGGEIFAIGENFQVLLRLPVGGNLHADEQWQRVGVPAQVGPRQFRSLWSPGPARLVIVGTGGLVLAYDRGTWAVEPTGVTDDLLAVWGTETDGIFAAGASGRLLYRGAGGWQTVPTGRTEPLVAIHGRLGGRVVMVGAGGAVLEVVR